MSEADLFVTVGLPIAALAFVVACASIDITRSLADIARAIRERNK